MGISGSSVASSVSASQSLPPNGTMAPPYSHDAFRTNRSVRNSFFEHPRVVKRNFQEVVEIPAPVSHRRRVWYDHARSLGSAPTSSRPGGFHGLRLVDQERHGGG